MVRSDGVISARNRAICFCVDCVFTPVQEQKWTMRGTFLLACLSAPLAVAGHGHFCRACAAGKGSCDKLEQAPAEEVDLYGSLIIELTRDD